MNAFRSLCRIGWIRRMISNRSAAQDPGWEKRIFNLSFKNPVGLGAGFDKNALYLTEWEILGFGFVEIGTVTPLPQPGNEKPRLFRLAKDKALINRMGFNNDGVKAIAERLRAWKKKKNEANIPDAATSRIIIGGNIGKNKTTPNEEAWKDYETCFRELFDCVDYFVVNVSSPNTADLRELQEKNALREILAHLQNLNRKLAANAASDPKPLLVKIAPDLNGQQLDDIIDLAQEIKLDGLVAANTSTTREHLLTPDDQVQSMGEGGLSGLPLKKRSTAIIQHIHKKTAGTLPMIASGGIFTAQDAKDKIMSGASLIQVWTGFIYEGPFIVRKILNNHPDQPTAPHESPDGRS